jgi:phosphatidylinositol glycan class B
LSPFLYIRDRFPKIVDPTFPPSAFPSSPPGVSDQRHWSHTWPSHIVLFGALLDVTEDGITIRQLLIETGYAETWKVGNGWEEDEKRRGGVSVWEWSIE